MNDCISLAQPMLPKIAETLCGQRGRQYCFGEGANDPEYPVSDQITGEGDINKTPVNNLEQEIQFGYMDRRLKKKGTIEACSRGVILKVHVI